MSKDFAALRAFVGEALLWRTEGGYRMRNGVTTTDGVGESRPVRLASRLWAAGGKASDNMGQYVNGECVRIAYGY